MSDHRHPRCATSTPASGTERPASDLAIASQLHRQLLEANHQLELRDVRIRDLERMVSRLLCWGLVPFAEGELVNDPDRANAMRSHLGTCEDCRARLVEYEQLSAQLTTLTTSGGRDG